MTLPPPNCREHLDTTIARLTAEGLTPRAAYVAVILACCDGKAHVARSERGPFLRAGMAATDWRRG